MLKRTTLMLAILANPVLAADLPLAIDCYQSSANAKDIDAYIACFTEDAEMIDVSRTYDSRIGQIAGSARSCRPPIDLHQSDQLAPSAVWSSVVSKRDKHGVPRHSAPHEHDLCKLDDERGSEVSLGRLRQDQLVQSQI